MHARHVSTIALAVVLTVSAALPAWAQADFTGVWLPRYHEDYPERIPGPDLGD